MLGGGTLALNAADHFSGNTLIGNGTLQLGNNLALQNTSGRRGTRAGPCLRRQYAHLRRPDRPQQPDPALQRHVGHAQCRQRHHVSFRRRTCIEPRQVRHGWPHLMSRVTRPSAYETAIPARPRNVATRAGRRDGPGRCQGQGPAHRFLIGGHTYTGPTAVNAGTYNWATAQAATTPTLCHQRHQCGRQRQALVYNVGGGRDLRLTPLAATAV